MAASPSVEGARRGDQVVASKSAIPSRTQGIDRAAQDGFRCPDRFLAAWPPQTLGRESAQSKSASAGRLPQSGANSAEMGGTSVWPAQLAILPVGRFDVS